MTVRPLAARSLRSLLHEESDIRLIAAHLDALSPEERLAQCLVLSGNHLAMLYRISRASPPLGLDDFVSSELAPGAVVRFGGKNSLPVFRQFEKHFTRYDGRLIGRNVHAASALTGPGYFTVELTEIPSGAVRFNYTDVPKSVPPAWPAPVPNDQGVGRFVYHLLFDYNRRVSRDVIIGAATRGDRPLKAYYILVRLAA